MMLAFLQGIRSLSQYYRAEHTTNLRSESNILNIRIPQNNDAWYHVRIQELWFDND